MAVVLTTGDGDARPFPRVLIVTEHASARFGGEAALPLHHFRELLARGVPVWLITHARVREELAARFPEAADRIHYIEDQALHRWMWRLGTLLPDRLSYFTTGYVSRLSTQRQQRQLARQLIRQHAIEVVHQPMPVSPKEPSLLFDLGAPVIIGPMNGGMSYPPGWSAASGRWVTALEQLGRAMAGTLNRLMPGKRRAALLLVANERTRRALPAHLPPPVRTLVENGVDLRLWQRPAAPDTAAPATPRPVRFVFMGRLIDLKAADLMIEAFAEVRRTCDVTLTLIGDGPSRPRLEAQSEALGLLGAQPHLAGQVHFAGWQAQAECARLLAQEDVLVLPSLRECGGAVVLEAMACAKPVIATAWGGPLDYLDADCGVLIPPESRQQLVAGLRDAMIRMAQDPAWRQRLGAHGRARVEREFDWRRKSEHMLDIYREVIPSAR